MRKPGSQVTRIAGLPKVPFRADAKVFPNPCNLHSQKHSNLEEEWSPKSHTFPTLKLTAQHQCQKDSSDTGQPGAGGVSPDN